MRPENGIRTREEHSWRDSAAEGANSDRALRADVGVPDGAGAPSPATSKLEIDEDAMA